MSVHQTVLITGCSDNGIGSALALTSQSLNFHVFATARNPSKMVHIIAAVEAVKNHTHGTLDLLINYSGRNHCSPVLDIDIADAKQIYDINLWGALEVMVLSETLRLEMVPLRVTVLFVVTGAVQTKGQTYFQDWKPPEDIMYKPIEDLIAEKTMGSDGVERMDRIQYAKYVIGEVVEGKSGKIWQRNNAAGVGVFLLLQSMMDSGLAKGTGLDQLGGESG